MPKQIDEETWAIIRGLVMRGMPNKAISQIALVSRSSIVRYKNLLGSVNPETGEPFESITAMLDYSIKQKINPNSGKAYTSLYEYNDWLAQRRINPETKNPFGSISAYNRFLHASHKNDAHPLTRCRRTRIDRHTVHEDLEYQLLSTFLTTRLHELGKSQNWLAHQTGISRQCVAHYVKRRSLPSQETLQKIFIALDVRYCSLDAFVEDMVEKNVYQ